MKVTWQNAGNGPGWRFSARTCFFCMGILVLVGSAHALEPVRLVVPEFPPLTYLEDGELRGLGIERMRQIMQKAELPYEFEHVLNYLRAAALVSIGEKDGFFLATRNEKRDSFAIFLRPVYINRWSWFLPQTSSLDPTDVRQKIDIRAGSVQGTNTHWWLQKNGFTESARPRNVELLIRMLDSGRVDAAFLSEPVFKHAVLTSGRELTAYRTVVQEEKPMGIYLSREFLKLNPDVETRMNNAIEVLSSGWE